MVSAWWLVVAASLGFSAGFLLIAVLTMARDDERSESVDYRARDTTPQHA
jgi:hypothetical protein